MISLQPAINSMNQAERTVFKEGSIMHFNAQNKLLKSMKNLPAVKVEYDSFLIQLFIHLYQLYIAFC